MNDEVKKIYNPANDIFGYPQNYKNVEFYPLLVKDLEYIGLFNIIFTYPKQSSLQSC